MLASGSVFAQKAPRYAKSITITIDTTSGRKATINNIASYLLSKNYEIDLINHDLGLVQTKDATLKFSHWRHRISANLIGDKLRFTGKAVVDDTPFDIENKGSLGSLQVHAFRKLQEVALGYQHSEMKYQ